MSNTSNIRKSSSAVAAAIASVTSKRSGLIDILEPREPLPVELPPIADIRQVSAKQNRPLKQRSIEADQQVPFVQGDDDPNPFSYPKNVEQFIEMLDEFKAKDRLTQQNIPTLMKGTKGFKQSQIVLARIKPFLQPVYRPSLAQDYKKVIWKAQHGLGINHLQKVSRKMHSEYIMQRKEIYYLRRAVRARKIALEMIKQSKEFEETCLSKYEWLTDFTKDAFETFLRENDEATQRAAKRAEATLKEKLDKALEVRQLNIQINQIKSDIVGTNESLRECKSYMRFLEDISREIMRKDEEEEHRAQRREKQVKEELVDYMKQGMSLKDATLLVEQRANAYTEEHEQPGKSREALMVGGSSGSSDFVADLGRAVRVNIGLPEEFTDPPPEPEPKGRLAKQQARRAKRALERQPPTPNEIAASLVKRTESRLANVTAKHEKIIYDLIPPPASDKKEKVSKDSESVKSDETGKEDEDGYNEKALLTSLELVPGNEKTDRRELGNLSFTKPSQLLAIYSDMEEANLSLIQHSQASEELLEKVQHEIAKTRKQLNHRGKLLRDEISSMQANIDMDEERAKALGMLFEMFTGGNYDVRKQQKLYRILQQHIVKVYQAAVGTVDHHLNPTMMLTSVEKNFEDLMKEIQAMPIEIVLQISRELDKERREMERVEQINKKKDQYDERKSRSIARAEAPIQLKKGRPILARSRPPKTIIKLSQAELEKKAEEDEFNYFFGP
ncbi:Coiled-coil domain-containing protein 37 [Orchesella cincta]|uniref:Coiled-coil domain-containing protein 37 n=1 Tax=Orchesella cincta TaxID=48709 RepID=A0A1D2MQ71_ORCCI|nr:Coiled-coil domain-containing protein 37 [Orchesella cincta]